MKNARIYLLVCLLIMSCAHQSQINTQIPEAKVEGTEIDCRLGEIDKGFNKLQTMYKDNEMKSSYWLTLGNCSILKMDFDRAYYFFKIALTKTKDKQEEARVYNNLGVLLWKKNNHKDAVEHFLEAKKRGTLLSPIFNLCSLYVSQGQLALAQGLISEAPKELGRDPEWKMLTDIVKGQ